MKKRNKILKNGKKYLDNIKGRIRKCLMMIIIVSGITNNANSRIKIIVDVSFTDIQEENSCEYKSVETMNCVDVSFGLKVILNTM